MSTTIFRNVSWPLSGLIEAIALGQIGLPDIQRPFVWETAKVRDLFDSMYQGYPVGHLLLWSSGAEAGARQIGHGQRDLAPSMLIVDGQQRLTSLFAVMTQREVITKDFSRQRIRIAFRPKDETFAVTDATIERDRNYIPDIGEVFRRDAFGLITEFLTRLREHGTLDPEDEIKIPEAISKLASLRSYPFTALVLGEEVSEEKVAEVFVRINSKGKNLNQSDFILTLMSVFWEEGRKSLETWCRDARIPGNAAWNPFLSPDPDQLLRVAIALGFRRGRLEDAYTVLRGRDPKSGKISPELRAAQFAILEPAQERVLDAKVWKEFLQCLVRAGHRSGATISSNLAVVYAYALYLIGKHDYGMPPKQLRDLMARWFFFTSLTGRYSLSPESTISSDLQALPTEATPTAFTTHLEKVMAERLTNDYWQITLPSELATSASRSPTLFGYLASLNILGAQVLFSKMRCSELADPAMAGGSPKVQRHHLFPRKFLEGIGVADQKQINQIANLTPLEWHDNIGISATDPVAYWPRYVEAMRTPPPGMLRFADEEIERMLDHHALWESWPSTPYEEFLVERRKRMAGVIREAFDTLVDSPDALPPTWPPSSAAIDFLLQEGETSRVEMKSSLRADTLGRGVPHRVLEKVVARTVAAFLNAHGGILIVGVDDNGQPLGLSADIATLARKDIDGFQQTLVQVISNYLGPAVAAALDFHLARVGTEDHDVALVRCRPHPTPVFLTDGESPEFHVRTGNTTRLLNVQEATQYIAQHWKSRPGGV